MKYMFTDGQYEILSVIQNNLSDTNWEVFYNKGFSSIEYYSNKPEEFMGDINFLSSNKHIEVQNGKYIVTKIGQETLFEYYKLAVLKVLMEIGTDKVVQWTNVAKRAKIPTIMVNDFRNILYHQGYITKVGEAKGMGHLISATPLLTSEVYGIGFILPQNETQYHEKIEAKKTTTIIRIKSVGIFISNNPLVSGIIATVIGGLILWLILE